MRTVQVLAIILAFSGLALPLPAHSTVPAGSERLLDRLLYAHVVVECTIESVDLRSVVLADPYTGNRDKKEWVLVAKLSNVVVLRGYGKPMEVSFNIDLDPAKLVGRRLILCCYWHPKLKMFEVPNENCAFLRIGDHWVDMRRVVGFPPERRVAVTTAEVNALIQETTLPALTGKADLIVIGQVRAVVDSSIAAPGQQQYRVQKVVLKVQRVLKGPPRAHAAWFLVARGHELPSWDTVTPRSLGVGETWMVFLRRDGDIFYPLGGVNGLLLLEGQKVFFDRTVRVPISRSMLTWKISQAVNK